MVIHKATKLLPLTNQIKLILIVTLTSQTKLTLTVTLTLTDTVIVIFFWRAFRWHP